MELDRDTCLRALRAKDARFDGRFVSAVVTTGIYCRPSCPATPLPRNVRFLPSAAAAHGEGFRACLRCRPDAVLGSPEWDARNDLAARAMRLIDDGALDRGGVGELAGELGYSRRQVERALRAELGAGALELARARRAHTARLLLETTGLKVAEIALSAGFGSVRQANETIRAIYGRTPGELRARRSASSSGGPAIVSLRLPVRAPFDPGPALGHLLATAVPGVEEWRDGAYRRVLRLPASTAIVSLRPGSESVACRLLLGDPRDLGAAVARCRRLLDLDCDPVAIAELLGADPRLAPSVARRPGLRVPRTVDPRELALRVVLGQQISTAAARTHAGRLASAYGERIEDSEGKLERAFPEPSALAGLDPDSLPLPRSRAAALTDLARALADGSIDLGPGAERRRTRGALRALPGIGPWSEEVIAMRGLGDPDVLCAGDLGIRRSAATLGLEGRELERHARRWAPWRSYAAQYLWAEADHEMNRLALAS